MAVEEYGTPIYSVWAIFASITHLSVCTVFLYHKVSAQWKEVNSPDIVHLHKSLENLLKVISFVTCFFLSERLLWWLVAQLLSSWFLGYLLSNYKDLLLFCVTEMASSILDLLIWNELSGAGASLSLSMMNVDLKKNQQKTNIHSQRNKTHNRTNNNKRISP